MKTLWNILSSEAWVGVICITFALSIWYSEILDPSSLVHNVLWRKILLGLFTLAMAGTGVGIIISIIIGITKRQHR